MQYASIKGSVTEVGHEKWIELESAQMGVHRNVKDPAGGAMNREAGVPSVSEIVVTKTQDDASADLFKTALSGKGKKVVIDFCRTAESVGQPSPVYMKVEMENTLISSYNISGHGGPNSDRPMESLALNFTKITYNAFNTAPGHTQGGPTRVMWDLAEHKGA
jgi:type VI secretion system secreted protein Hcp